MRPEIEAYLRDHGARYTTEALRARLIHAGYEPMEVEAALEDTEATRGPQLAETRTLRLRFWRWALVLHLAALAGIGAASLRIGSFAGSWGLLVILAVVLLIGLAISGLIGRGAVQDSGLTAALLLPAISAVLIGGSCLALGGSYLLRAPPRTGGMELQIDPPLSFEGSGVARCDTSGGTSDFVVWADDLGKLDSSIVSVSLDSSTKAAVNAAEYRNLSITLYPAGNKPPASYSPVAYSPIFSTRIELDASPDGRSGTLRFEGLEPARFDRPPGEATGLEPISGTITWTCK